MNRVVAILCLAGAIGLAHGASAEQPDGAIDELSPCPESTAVVPDGWQSIRAPQGHIGFALPPDLHRDSGKPFFRHGGERWLRSGFEVKVTYGKWRLSSFKPDRADDVCRTQLHGVPAVVFVRSGERGHELTAWLRTDDEPYEPVLGIKFDQSSDDPIARQILDSVRWATGNDSAE